MIGVSILECIGLKKVQTRYCHYEQHISIGWMKTIGAFIQGKKEQGIKQQFFCKFQKNLKCILLNKIFVFTQSAYILIGTIFIYWGLRPQTPDQEEGSPLLPQDSKFKMLYLSAHHAIIHDTKKKAPHCDREATGDGCLLQTGAPAL